MLHFDKPASIEQATAQRDAFGEMLHDFGVQTGLIDPQVSCDGPQLLTAIGTYVDHLKFDGSSHPVLVGALNEAWSGLETDHSTGSRHDPLYLLLKNLFTGGEDDPVNIAVQIEALQETLAQVKARMAASVPASTPGPT